MTFDFISTFTAYANSPTGAGCYGLMGNGSAGLSNMGHNIDQTYRAKYPGLVAKTITISGGWVNLRG